MEKHIFDLQLCVHYCFHYWFLPSNSDCKTYKNGHNSVQVKELQNPDVVFETIIGAVIRLAEHGLIHCDFNEFNIMVSYNPSLIYLKLSLYLTAIIFCFL